MAEPTAFHASHSALQACSKADSYEASANEEATLGRDADVAVARLVAQIFASTISRDESERRWGAPHPDGGLARNLAIAPPPLPPPARAE